MEERKIVEDAIKKESKETDASTISTYDVITIAKHLTELKNYGKDIKKAMQSAQTTPQNVYDEMYFNRKAYIRNAPVPNRGRGQHSTGIGNWLMQKFFPAWGSK